MNWDRFLFVAAAAVTPGIPAVLVVPLVLNPSLREKAAGIILVAPTGRALFLLRDDGYWGIPGGRIEPGESPEQAMRRELQEETEHQGPIQGVEVLARQARPVEFTTFVGRVLREFRPVLNEEHSDYRWLDPKEALALQSLHPGLRQVLVSW